MGRIKAVKGSQVTRLGRIEIPSVKLNAAFYAGVTPEVLVHGPGHWPGTPLAGELGNSVLSGHRVTHTHPFLHLDRLRAGNGIRTTWGNRSTVFSVTRITIVDEATYVSFVLRQPSDRRQRLLTLFACNPKNTHLQRIVVQARAVRSEEHPRLRAHTDKSWIVHLK